LLQVDDDEDQDNNVNSSVKHLLQKVEENKRKVSDLDIEQHCIRNKICGILEYQDTQASGADGRSVIDWSVNRYTLAMCNASSAKKFNILKLFGHIMVELVRVGELPSLETTSGVEDTVRILKDLALEVMDEDIKDIGVAIVVTPHPLDTCASH